MAKPDNVIQPVEASAMTTISIEGHACSVPANDTVLRCFQFLEVDVYACRLCWNGDCDNCRFSFVDPTSGQELSAKSCLTEVTEGLKVTRLPLHSVWQAPVPTS